MRLESAVAVVTGASSGIGAATALRLHNAGARLVLHGRDSARLEELAARCPGSVVVSGDLADLDAVPALAERMLAAHGQVDLLVNNAGIGWAGSFAEMPAADLRRVVDVNLTAPMELTRALLPALRQRPRAAVVFVTSIAGRTAVAGEAVYSAVKSGLDTFADSLRFELTGTGVHVGVVVPGVVETEFFARRGRPYQRSSPKPIPADRVAEAIVRAARGRAEEYRPRWLRLPVAVRGLAPGLYRTLAARFGGSA